MAKKQAAKKTNKEKDSLLPKGIDDADLLRLKELGVYYSTDKVEHGYMDIYHDLFQTLTNSMNSPIRLLEVGIYKGASLRTWKDYLPKGSEIHGMDDSSYLDCESFEFLEKEGFIVHNGSQTDIPFMANNIKGQFDIIIEDGDHYPGSQQIAFRHLFANNLKAGGVYVIEDAHTSFDDYWSKGLEIRDRTIPAFTSFQLNKSWGGSKFFPEYEFDYWKHNIAKVEIRWDKIIIVTKTC